MLSIRNIGTINSVLLYRGFTTIIVVVECLKFFFFNHYYSPLVIPQIAIALKHPEDKSNKA